MVSQNQDGRLEAFVIGSDQALWHIWQTAPGGTWSTWASLGNPPGTQYNSTPMVSQNQDGRLEAFVIGSDQALWHIWQTAPGGTWGNWFSSGGPHHGNPSISHSTVRKNEDGRLEVFLMIETIDEPFGTNPSGTLWHIWQVVPNGTWSSWASLGTPTTGGLSAPSVGENADGRLEAFVIGPDGALWHIWQIAPGGSWGSWASLGAQSSSVKAIGDPFVAENDDGRLEAFAIGSDGALWHTWQVSPGGSWGS
jgi:acylphosphatase